MFLTRWGLPLLKFKAKRASPGFKYRRDVLRQPGRQNDIRISGAPTSFGQPASFFDTNMTIQQIQRLREKQPFEPFRIIAADGSRYDVRYPENLASTGNGRIIVVAMEDYAATLDLLLVTGIEQPIPQRKNRTGRKAS
jgi:hypothetical protein